jgi:holo-[acyl-carrier protein] synthase
VAVDPSGRRPGGLVVGGTDEADLVAVGPVGGLVGLGSDLVDLDRFRLVLARTPAITERLFTDHEQAYAWARHDPTERFGGRFAAKEATMKALGVGLGQVRFRDLEVIRLDSGAPVLVLHGPAADLAAAQGITEWRVTISHTAHLAQAIVVALGAGRA